MFSGHRVASLESCLNINPLAKIVCILCYWFAIKISSDSMKATIFLKCTINIKIIICALLNAIIQQTEYSSSFLSFGAFLTHKEGGCTFFFFFFLVCLD